MIRLDDWQSLHVPHPLLHSVDRLRNLPHLPLHQMDALIATRFDASHGLRLLLHPSTLRMRLEMLDLHRQVHLHCCCLLHLNIQIRINPTDRLNVLHHPHYDHHHRSHY